MCKLSLLKPERYTFLIFVLCLYQSIANFALRVVAASKNVMMGTETRLGCGTLFCINDTTPTDGYTTVT